MQTFICIYNPVYVDAYGCGTKKQTWMSIMSLSGPLGVISGYGMTAFILSFENLTYRHSFGLQGIL